MAGDALISGVDKKRLRIIFVGLIGSIPLQLSHFGEMPLQKHKLEICHSNFSIPLYMPF
jgi:hypothetical protein